MVRPLAAGAADAFLSPTAGASDRVSHVIPPRPPGMLELPVRPAPAVEGQRRAQEGARDDLRS